MPLQFSLDFRQKYFTGPTECISEQDRCYGAVIDHFKMLMCWCCFLVSQ